MGFLDTAAKQIAGTLIPLAGTTSAVISRRGEVDSYHDEVLAPTTYACSVVLDEFSRERHASLFLMDGETVRPGDKIAYIPAQGLSITPSPEKDTLVVGGSETWQVVRVRQVRPGTVTAMYALLVRA